jgi:hypothetical protein
MKQQQLRHSARGGGFPARPGFDQNFPLILQG